MLKEILDVRTSPAAQLASEIQAEIGLAEINRSLEEAGRRFWAADTAAPEVALRLLKRFGETAGALESRGWPAERIREHLAPSRKVFATSPFMRRCQEWPRGYAGDFETIEYLAAGVNHGVPGTLGWHIEKILLESPVVQQHRNKLNLQSLEIARGVNRSSTARVLSIACGGGLDLLPVLPCLGGFAGEIVLNDCEPAALDLAAHRLQPATTRFRLVPGNVLRVARQLARGGPFDTIIAGGLFDYLPDRAVVFLLRLLFQDLLARGGVLLFTNMAEGNPWRALMRYGADWTLIERSESCICELLEDKAGIPRGWVALKRESTGLALIVRVEAMEKPQHF